MVGLYTRYCFILFYGSLSICMQFDTVFAEFMLCSRSVDGSSVCHQRRMAQKRHIFRNTMLSAIVESKYEGYV